MDDSDIIRFVRASTGETTSGSLELYFDGSDVGRSSNQEDIYGLAGNDAARFITTNGNIVVDRFRGVDRDVTEFNPTTLGANTSGTWLSKLVGQQSDLASASEDIWALSVTNDSGGLYISTFGAFRAGDISGGNSDIVASDLDGTQPIPSYRYEILLRGADILEPTNRRAYPCHLKLQDHNYNTT